MSFNLTQITNKELLVKLIPDDTLQDTVEYGVRWVVGQSDPVGERVKRVNGELFVGVATNLVANIGIDDEIVENSFDNIDIFKTTREIIDGNVLIKRKLYFVKIETKKENGTTYEYKWMSAKKLPGYIRPHIFYDNNGEKVDYSYIARYEASDDGSGVAKSVSGKFPWVSITRNNSRKAARKNDGNGDNTDSDYGMRDLPANEYEITIPFEIEFATRHSQSIMVGATDMAYSDARTALTNETNANIIVLTNEQANGFVIGQTIGIGTSRSNSSVANNRIVLSIQEDTPVADQATITFDGDPVDITIGDVIATQAWKTGMTDGVKASSGCFRANDNKHPFMFRGIENPWGNIYEFIDGGKVVDHQLWVTTDRTAYDDVASVGGEYAAPFVPVSYKNALANGYVNELGYDEALPFARLPIVTGASGAGASAYYADYYYQDSGDKTLLFGGYWNSTTYAGLFFWSVSSTLGHSRFAYGFRLSYRPLKKGVS